MLKYAAVIALVAIAGCGADAEESCDNYIDAWVACIDEAYADDADMATAAKDATAGTCDSYSGLSGSAATDAADLLDCYADTIDAGDCSTPEAYSATVADISSCI